MPAWLSEFSELRDLDVIGTYGNKQKQIEKELNHLEENVRLHM